ncbi:phage tail tube protein, partial [Vibrio lentus]
STLNPGGVTNTSHNGPKRIWGFSQEFVPSTLSVVIAADEDVDVVAINAMKNVTLTFEGDNGLDYMITDANPQDPFVLSDSGEITGTYIGNPAVPV